MMLICNERSTGRHRAAVHVHPADAGGDHRQGPLAGLQDRDGCRQERGRAGEGVEGGKDEADAVRHDRKRA